MHKKKPPLVRVYRFADHNEMVVSIEECTGSLRRYQENMLEDCPCLLTNHPITQLECRNRLSMFLEMCPVCRVDENQLNRPNDSMTARRHMVQYRFRFYWVCPEHWHTFSGDPFTYVDATPAENPGPELLPRIVTTEDVADNHNVLYENVSTFCVVCALANSLWDPVYRRGKSALMASYSKYTFAFCSKACRDEFMRRPYLYSRYKMIVRGPEDMSEPSGVIRLDVQRLPVLGYLEQTIGVPIDTALRALVTTRPIYPGQSIEVSALLFLGLHVGMDGNDKHLKEYYQNVFELFVRTCHKFKMAAIELKSII